MPFSFARTPFLALALLVSCASNSGTDSSTLRVLFIGNSHTYMNDVPAQVATMASAGGDKLEYETVTLPGVALEDHWVNGIAQAAIRRGDWDYVVMQQGPSSQPDSRENLIEFGGKFAEVIGEAGARPAFYMVWPAESRAQDRDGVRASYTAVAQATGGILAPAGEAWRAAWRRDATLRLYSDDGTHASQLGAYTAALTIYEQLFGKSPLDLPAPGGMSPSTAKLLQQAAAQADAEYGRK